MINSDDNTDWYRLLIVVVNLRWLLEHGLWLINQHTSWTPFQQPTLSTNLSDQLISSYESWFNHLVTYNPQVWTVDVVGRKNWLHCCSWCLFMTIYGNWYADHSPAISALGNQKKDRVLGYRALRGLAKRYTDILRWCCVDGPLVLLKLSPRCPHLICGI